MSIKESLLPYVLFTFAVSIVSFIILKVFGTSQLLPLWNNIYNPVWLVIPFSIIQEVVFRGWLIPLLKAHFSQPVKVIFVNSLFFAAAHIIFPHPELVIPGAFLAGIGFAAMYYYYPNLMLISISHIILNFLIIPYCHLKLVSC